MTDLQDLPRYARDRSYEWNYQHAPDPVEIDAPRVPGSWRFCGLKVDSPLGVPAGPLLNGRWVRYYASLGFDVLTYKTVRSRPRECYPLPNLQPVDCGQLAAAPPELPAADAMRGSWAVAFGMPSQPPEVWRADVEETRRLLPKGKLLSVSVVGSMQEGWTLDDLADDYARCAKWAVESGADCVETNFSCPNVATCDGQLYQDFTSAALVAERVRQAVDKTPYIIKIGHLPRRDDAARLLEAVSPHADALAMTNSIATKVRGADGKLLFEGQKRGVCGVATRTASIEQVRTFAESMAAGAGSMRLIGVGGAACADDVRAYLAAGAEAVHLATAAMTNPGVALEIRKQL